MFLFISQRVNTLIRMGFLAFGKVDWTWLHIFWIYDIQWERWYQIGCWIGGFYFPQAFPCTASTGRRGRVQTQLKGCTTEALLRPARKRKILEPQNPLVELKTSSNGKTRPFAVGDSQCAGEGARGDGELLCFFQFCFLKLLIHAQMGNLQENLHNTMHKPVEGEEELTSPCSVLSITSSKESVARWSFTFCDYDASSASFFCFFFRCLVRPSIQLPGWKWTSTKKDLHIREHSVLHLPCSQEFLWPSTPGAQEPEWLSSCFLNCEHVTSKSSTIPAF